CLIFLAMLASQVVAQEKRLALIVGNGNYSAGALRNPLNDARAMDSTLRALGFETMVFENLNLGDFKKSIDEFGARLQGYDIGLFYYAGHGIQLKGRNYLIPVEANLRIEQQIEYDCVAADRVLAFMEHAKTKVNLLILDACRNNPFERSWSRGTNSGGLAFMNAPSGSLIAYATSPGNVASDGTDENGLYTSVLLKHISTPNLTVEQVFKRVRSEVEERTGKSQIPWESTSLKGDFYFSATGDTTHVQTDPIIIDQDAAARSQDIGVGNLGGSRIKLLAEVPVQFGVGLEAPLSKKFSIAIQAGILTEPNSTLAIKTFEWLGTDKDIIIMIERAFKKGSVLEVGLNYNFPKSYLGVFYQRIILSGADSPSATYESYFGVDLENDAIATVKPGRPSNIEPYLTIESSFSQIGITYGRRFYFKNPRLGIDMELGISKNVGSITKVSSENRNLTTFSERVNDELDHWYLKYATIPSLTMALTYKLSK
ncbi:MAG: caspase family protein, partial [Flammeovirgaceae bacterium]|nr:caspase family protein [Flammeovirgaceae bacterium]